ncbi:hypothetical protein [uncultured Megasphaera sp.]|uniref:hypothetical protein n=1 Tax=uncultured Megasphaera sp. TaxID=165188 RepID=UPI002659CFB1|nr:hypothetical protein [uncultured Megasphaera sp.]
MKKLDITIQLMSPVVLTMQGSSLVLTESNEYISGCILRGLLAERYISQNHL